MPTGLTRVACRLRAPTISKLHGESGFAVQVAAESAAVPALVHTIKETGGCDIVVTTIKMLIP